MTGPEWWTLSNRPNERIWGPEGVLPQIFFGNFLKAISGCAAGARRGADARHSNAFRRELKTPLATCESMRSPTDLLANGARKPLKTKGLRRCIGKIRHGAMRR